MPCRTGSSAWETHARAVSEADQSTQVEAGAHRAAGKISCGSCPRRRSVWPLSSRLWARRRGAAQPLARLGFAGGAGARRKQAELTAALTAGPGASAGAARCAAGSRADPGAGARCGARRRAPSSPRSRPCRRRRSPTMPGGQVSGCARAGLAARPRLAAALEVESGWERAVETGPWRLSRGRMLSSAWRKCRGRWAQWPPAASRSSRAAARAPGGLEETIAAHVAGPATVSARLASVLTAASLGDALRGRAGLPEGRSFVTRRGRMGRAGLAASEPGERIRARACIGREHRLKALRAAATAADAQVTQLGGRTECGARAAGAGRRASRAGAGGAPGRPSETRRSPRPARGRPGPRPGIEPAGRERLRQDLGAVAHERAATEEALARAAAALARAQAQSAELEERLARARE